MSADDEKEKAAAIAVAVAAGWFVARITKRGYTIMRCSCGEHQETLTKTPGNRNTFRQKAKRMVSVCSSG